MVLTKHYFPLAAQTAGDTEVYVVSTAGCRCTATDELPFFTSYAARRAPPRHRRRFAGVACAPNLDFSHAALSQLITPPELNKLVPVPNGNGNAAAGV